jgi:hypothetical protein
MADIDTSRAPKTGASEPTWRRVPSRERSVWREEALIRADELEALLLWVEQQSAAEIAEPVADQVRRHLEVARSAAVDGARSPLGRRLMHATNSADFERIAGNLDAAEAELLRIAPESFVRGQVRVLVAKVRRLPLGDARRTAVEELARRPRGEELSEADRSALISAIRAANADTRRDLVRVRSLRNVLAATTVLMTLLAIALAVVGYLRPDMITLCYVPGNAVICPTNSTSVQFEEPTQTLDDTIRTTASPYDIAVVELAGLLGAALAAVMAIRRFPGKSIPYNPVLLLGVLKLPTGALTAVLGLLLIRGQFIPGFAALDTTGQILAWAVVLGFGQQLFTRPVDDQVLKVLSAVEAPTEREAVGLDTQTAEAFTAAVSTTLRSSAPTALREAIAGPRLVNYSGWVTLQFLDAAGLGLEPPEQRRLILAPGEPNTLRVVIGREARDGVAMALRVTEGIEEETVRFGVDLDSNDRRLQQPQQPVTVGSHEGEATVDFPLVVEDDLPYRWVWVRVSQRRQVVLQVELEVLTLDRRA